MTYCSVLKLFVAVNMRMYSLWEKQTLNLQTYPVIWKAQRRNPVRNILTTPLQKLHVVQNFQVAMEARARYIHLHGRCVVYIKDSSLHSWKRPSATSGAQSQWASRIWGRLGHCARWLALSAVMSRPSRDWHGPRRLRKHVRSGASFTSLAQMCCRSCTCAASYSSAQNA